MRFVKSVLPLIVLVAWMMAVYLVTLSTGKDLVSLSFLLGFPFVAGGVMVAFRPKGAFKSFMGAMAWVVIVMIASLALSRISGLEGFICIAMACVPILGAGLLGGVIAVTIQRVKADRKTTTGVYLLPLLAVWGLDQIPTEPQFYTISNTIEIAAPVGDVFDFIKEIRDIRPEEIDTRASHLLGVPKPTEALWLVEEDGVTRHSYWGPKVHFLERITRIEPDRRIEWRFEFPEGWAAEGIEDPHVKIGGKYVDVLNGGYLLEPLGKGRTRLVLTTRTRDSSGMGAYARFWHHFFIEDFHMVILDLVKARLETA
ncbi:polyketide cyclase/dehydrase [Celeribacter ethanolicus]|uniref:polyketide cyclase/dehydrase n=1 Tax=Celeribacter ethanolicus TaxID=1758178 RepID=UPI000AF3005A|nr:polyketide cyclase/dehydrase [Celeribacter ethanolicus]